MSFGALAGLAAALGIALALLYLAARQAHRLTALPGLRRPRLPMEVVGRLGLGQRQGLAVVRIGERVVVVSVGDGGVHHVTDLDPAELPAQATTAATAAGVPASAGAPPRFQDRSAHGANPWRNAPIAPAALPVLAAAGKLWRRVRSAAGVASVLALLAIPAAARAQTVPTTPAAGAPAVPLAGVATSAATRNAATPPAAPRVARPAVAQAAPAAGAPRIDLQLGSGKASDLKLSGTVGMVLFIGLLALLPALLLLMTSFTRILIVLHFLRQALGTQTAPPGQMLAALALLLTGFVMAPTLAKVNEQALQPWMNGQIDQTTMMKTAVVPFREFMLRQTPEKDLARFVEMSGQPAPARAQDVSLPVLMSAFATSELRASFEMGFAIFLPFVVVDLVVSAVLTSMGMFMLPPTMIALPCKLLLFVLVDGWGLVVQSLVSSFK